MTFIEHRAIDAANLVLVESSQKEFTRALEAAVQGHGVDVSGTTPRPEFLVGRLVKVLQEEATKQAHAMALPTDVDICHPAVTAAFEHRIAAWVRGRLNQLNRQLAELILEHRAERGG